MTGLTFITKIYPLKPHFYKVKLGITGVYIICLISSQNIDCGYSLEPPRRGGSNEYPQSMFWAEIWKKYQFFFLSEKFQLLEVKFSIYLNRRVFVTSNEKSHNVRKRTFRHVRPAKIQISLRIRQGCSIFMRTTKTLIRMQEHAGWFESSFCRPCQKVLFVTWQLRYGVAFGVSWSINRHLNKIKTPLLSYIEDIFTVDTVKCIPLNAI